MLLKSLAGLVIVLALVAGGAALIHHTGSPGECPGCCGQTEAAAPSCCTPSCCETPEEVATESDCGSCAKKASCCQDGEAAAEKK